MKSIFLVALFVALASASKVRYDGYRVYRVTPVTDAHAQILKELEQIGVSFWDGPSGAGKKSDIQLAPHQQTDILDNLKNSGMIVEEYIENVQRLMDNEVTKTAKAAGDLTWDAYYSLSDIHAFLDKQASLHASASVVTYGQSYEGRDLKLIKIATSTTPKPAIFIEANIHAREWITGAVTTYIINELLNGGLQSELNSFDFYIVPITNPDGYEYTRNTDRSWRKTRSRTNSILGCRGADPNRNFDYEWFTGGSSNNPCLETFAGATAFSEIESKALADYFNNIGSRVRFYFSVHSYSQLILIPYGFTATPLPEYSSWLAVAQQGAQALRQRYGTVFTPGNIVDLLYPASGGSVDWIKGKFDTPLVLAAELRDTGRYGFLLPADQIIPSALELIDAFKVWLNYVRN